MISKMVAGFVSEAPDRLSVSGPWTSASRWRRCGGASLRRGAGLQGDPRASLALGSAAHGPKVLPGLCRLL